MNENSFSQPTPGKDWKVFIFNASHDDIGWHDLPAEVMGRVADSVDQAIELCDATKDAGDDLRYVITIEHAWIADYYLKHRRPEQFERMLACIRRGQMDIGAFYTSVHADLCGHEELARLCFVAAQMRRKYKIPLAHAMLNDVSEGYTMGLPQLLAKSGIEGLCFGPGVKVAGKGIMPRVPRIFHWQTPDGSRVIVAWTPGLWTYHRWAEAGMHGKQTIAEFDAMTDYPYDAFFRHGGKGDVQPPDPKLLDAVRCWREECGTRSIRLATMAEFFSHMRDRFAAVMPVVAGDNPHSWADGTNSLALETALHKRNQHDIIAAEALAAIVADDADYPSRQIQEVYNNLHLYSDHTWGYDFIPDGRPGEIRKARRATSQHGEIEIVIPEGGELTCRSPFFDFYREHWEAKKEYVRTAARITDGIARAALDRLFGRIAAARPSVAVWNPLSFERTDVARVPWTASTAPAFVTDPRHGTMVPCQLEDDGNDGRFLVFTAGQVPPVGYAVFEVPDAPAPAVEAVDTDTIENVFYRVRIDLKTGTLLSIYDKAVGREMVDGSAGYGFNQYIHNDVNAGFSGTCNMDKAGITYGEGNRYTPDRVESVTCCKGPVYSAFVSVAQLTKGPAPATIRRIVRVYHEIKKIDVVNIVDKQESLHKEQVYFAFPFDAGCKPTLHIELPYAVMRWDKDILPGCWRGYSSVQNFVRLAGGDSCVTWSSPGAPVATFGGLNSNHYDPAWHNAFVPSNASIYSYVMSNMWNCNYALFQGGRYVFPYSFTTARHMSLAQSARFGWATAHPLVARIIDAQQGTRPATPWSALRVDQDNVLVTAIKKAEDGQGHIIRLYETNQDEQTTVSFALNFITPKKAWLCMISEENLAEIPVAGNVINVGLKANELVSIRVVT